MIVHLDPAEQRTIIQALAEQRERQEQPQERQQREQRQRQSPQQRRCKQRH